MNSRLSNCATVFVTPDVKRTAAYYHNVLGFRVVEHYDKAEAFAALYRDSVEIIIVQSKFGEVLSNKERYGAGYDVYLAPEGVEGVDALYFELKAKGAKIAQPPTLTPYGSHEFVVEDIDGRLIGIGTIKHREIFFKNNV
jgi:catechol 2,3-dioxygenase-like lactoylglutathione lyase family enzyme